MCVFGRDVGHRKASVSLSVYWYTYTSEVYQYRQGDACFTGSGLARVTLNERSCVPTFFPIPHILVDEKELAELLVYIANELLGQNGVGSLPYMDSLWNYIKTTHSIDDSDDKPDFSGAAHLEVARAILNVSATYRFFFQTHRIATAPVSFDKTINM